MTGHRRLALVVSWSMVAGAMALAQPSSSLVLSNVWLIDGTGKPAVEHAWIRIKDDQVAAVGQGAAPAVPGGQILDLQGRTVVPGLSDMHVHLGDPARAKWMLKLLLAHGVTTVKDAGNALDHSRLIRRWMASDPALPHLYISGPILNGNKEEQRFLQPGPALAHQLEEEGAFGVDFLKVHNFVSSRSLTQIAGFGRAHGLYVTGHVPLGMTSVAAIDAGLTILEHLRLRAWEVIDDPETLARYPMDIPLVAREGFWAGVDSASPAVARTLAALERRRDRFFLDPTLVVAEAAANNDDPGTIDRPEVTLVSQRLRQTWLANRGTRFGAITAADYERARRAVLPQSRFVARARARGIRILTGTDTPEPWVVPGASLLRELELLVQGGLSPVEAIQASTGTAARALRNAVRGVLTPGQAADLVIVSGNVAADIHAIRKIERVMIGGRLYDRAALLRDASKLAIADPPTAEPSQARPSVSPPPRAADPSEVTFPSGSLTLHGFVWKPAGRGPFPVVLYNHGSEKNMEGPSALGPVFASHGYLFFLPHRRGQGLSSDEGAYIVEQLADERRKRGAAARSALLVKLHETDHLADQLAALEYLKTRSDVDVGKLAIAGCSFGGIQTVLSAELDIGTKAAIDFAGAAQTWNGSADMRNRLIAAARNARVPIYFMQAENDYNVAPSRMLAAQMEDADKPHLVRIFPPFGTTKDDGHEGFCYKGADVWGPVAFAFLDRTLGRRP
jgi:dienelactone hydrolase